MDVEHFDYPFEVQGADIQKTPYKASEILKKVTLLHLRRI